MFSLVKRFRDLALIAALLLVPLGVYFAHARRPSERSRLDRFFIVMTAPIERGVAWVVGGALDGWRGYAALRGAHERAQELSRRVNQLELERLEKVRIENENDRLRRLLSFAQSEPGFRVTGARVIGVRLDPKGLQLIRVDRGADQGIEKLMPVVIAQGVVGRVHAVTASTADVLLLTDLNSSIAVRVGRSRARANVRGTGDPDVCRLDYALRSDDLQEDDQLFTSGTDGIFPRGLPVGRIANLKKSGQGLYQKADVIPAVDVTKLEEVLVLTSRAEGGHDEAPPAASSTAPPGAKGSSQAVATKGAPPADSPQRAGSASPAPGFASKPRPQPAAPSGSPAAAPPRASQARPPAAPSLPVTSAAPAANSASAVARHLTQAAPVSAAPRPAGASHAAVLPPPPKPKAFVAAPISITGAPAVPQKPAGPSKKAPRVAGASRTGNAKPAPKTATANGPAAPAHPPPGRPAPVGALTRPASSTSTSHPAGAASAHRPEATTP